MAYVYAKILPSWADNLKLQTVWTLTRPDKMLGLIWIQTVKISSYIPEQIFRKS